MSGLCGEVDIAQWLWRLGSNTLASPYVPQHTHRLHCSVGHEPPWPVSPGQSHRSTRNDSWTTVPVMAPQCRNTHKHTTHTCHYISATTAVQHQLPPAPWIYLSVSLLASQLDRTRCSDGLVTWQWHRTDAGERPQCCPLHPALHNWLSCLSVDPLREKIHVSFSPSFSRQDREGHKHRCTAAPLFKYVLIFQFDLSFFFRWNLRLIELMTLYIAR